MTSITPGRYRHYKGKEYSVLGIARHSETQEELIVYRQDYGDHSLWVRPAQMFSETVLVDGQDVPRFRSLCAERTNSCLNADNLFDDLPSNLPDELVQTVLAKPNLRIERIVSNGHASPQGFWYDQRENEFVVLLKGAARLRFEDGEVELNPGDVINIPAHKKHRVEWTKPGEPTIWLTAHYED